MTLTLDIPETLGETLQMLFQYDAWATAQVLHAVLRLTPEQFTQEFGAERVSVRQQFVHLVSVGDRARCRFLRVPVPGHVSPELFPSPQSVAAYESDVRERLRGLLANLTEDALRDVRDFTTRSGTWHVSGADSLLHAVNHGTYHRGQIVMLLRMLGAAFPDTDFILWRDARRPS